MKKIDIKMFDPIDLLKGFYKKIDHMSFLEDRKDKIKSLLQNEKNTGLLDLFKEANSEYKKEHKKYLNRTSLSRQQKDPPQLSDYLDSHEIHEQGIKLWNELISSSIKTIEPNAKGNSKLFKYLDAATEFEDLLYGLERYYRDHTLHSLWVYLIGVKLMGRNGLLYDTARNHLNWYLFNDIKQDEKKYPYPPYLVEWSEFRRKYFYQYLQNKREAVWCIMALCHDLGYSLSKLSKLNKKVEKVLGFYHVSSFRHIGYSLDIDHQYLVTQFLELMAMDVRVVPGKSYEDLEEKIKQIIADQTDDKNFDDVTREDVEAEIKKIKRFQDTTLKKLKKELPDTLNLWEHFNEPSDDIAKTIEEETLVKCYRDDSTYWRLCKAFERKEHGVLSAYLLYKTLGIFADTYVRGSADEWGLDDEEVLYNVIRGDILFAIAQHEFAYAHLDQVGSMAEILILCDELEEFTRLGRQLQSRKYHDTAAKTGFKITTSRQSRSNDHNGSIIGDWVDIEMRYESQHENQQDFFGFFARKAERLCTLYSLNQKRNSNDVLHNPVASVKASFSWHNPREPKAKPKDLDFEINKDYAQATLYIQETKSKREKCKKCNRKDCQLSKAPTGRKYRVKCIDDKISLVTPCTENITLRNWLKVEEDG